MFIALQNGNINTTSYTLEVSTNGKYVSPCHTCIFTFDISHPNALRWSTKCDLLGWSTENEHLQLMRIPSNMGAHIREAYKRQHPHVDAFTSCGIRFSCFNFNTELLSEAHYGH